MKAASREGEHTLYCPLDELLGTAKLIYGSCRGGGQDALGSIKEPSTGVKTPSIWFLGYSGKCASQSFSTGNYKQISNSNDVHAQAFTEKCIDVYSLL